MAKKMLLTPLKTLNNMKTFIASLFLLAITASISKAQTVHSIIDTTIMQMVNIETGDRFFLVSHNHLQIKANGMREAIYEAYIINDTISLKGDLLLWCYTNIDGNGRPSHMTTVYFNDKKYQKQNWFDTSPRTYIRKLRKKKQNTVYLTTGCNINYSYYDLYFGNSAIHDGFLVPGAIHLGHFNPEWENIFIFSQLCDVN